MTGRAPGAPWPEFEPFGLAVGLSAVCGALSVMLPMFISPTATLAALSVTAWVARARQQRTHSPKGFGVRSAAALVTLAGAATAFLDPPAALLPVRGLVLATGLLPLFAVERSRIPRPAPTFGAR